MTEGTRIVWCFIIAAILVGLATYAFGAPSPFKEMPSARPQSLTDAKPTNERCIQATTVQRYMTKPDGKMRSLGGYTLWVTCA